MFTVQIGSLLTCRDECALEFALKVDRDAGGSYIGGNGNRRGAVLGPRHAFVGATEPMTVSLAALEQAQSNPLSPDGTVLVATNTANNTRAAAAASSSSSPHPPSLNLLAPPNWAPRLERCDWSRRDNMKADLEEAMGIDGVSYASYDQLKYGAGLTAEGKEEAKKNNAAAKRTAPKRQRNSVKMLKSLNNNSDGKKKRDDANAVRGKKRRGRGEDTSDDDEDEYDDLDDDSVDEDESGGLNGIYNENLGAYDDEDGASSGAGSVVEFSDGMEDDDDY